MFFLLLENCSAIFVSRFLYLNIRIWILNAGVSNSLTTRNSSKRFCAMMVDEFGGPTKIQTCFEKNLHLHNLESRNLMWKLGCQNWQRMPRTNVTNSFQAYCSVPDDTKPLSTKNKNVHNQSFQMWVLIPFILYKRLKKYNKKLRSKIAIVTGLKRSYIFAYAWHSLSILTT